MDQKDIVEILKGIGVDIPQDKLESFNKEFRTNFKSVAELNKITTDRDTYKEKYETLSKSIDGDDGLNTRINQLTQERDDFKNKYESVNGELTLVKGKTKALDAGVSKDFAEFVATQVNKQTNEKNDFDTALKDYVTKNPQYLEGSKVKVGTSLPLNGGGNDSTSVNQLMNNAILSAVGKNKI